jgi:hypothetical protein
MPIIIHNCGFVARLGYAGLSLGPFIFIAGATASARLLNHERIHWRQQREMLFVGQWVWYGVEYLARRLRGGGHAKAYRAISFEREAYGNQENLSYLATRRRWAWVQFLKQ